MILELNRILSDGVEILELVANELSVRILSDGNNLSYQLLFQDNDYLWFPYDSVSAYLENPRLSGIPLLAPWANRLEEAGFDFQGVHYSLNTSFDFSKDRNGLPIHGLLTNTNHWKNQSEVITENYVEVSSELHFWKYAELMTHFPFAHDLHSTYRLYPDRFEITLRVTNRGQQSMPVMIGYHPYFQLPETHRSNWQVTIPAREHLVLDSRNLPTGRSSISNKGYSMQLGDKSLDDLYRQLLGSPFMVEVGDRKLSVNFDYGYSAAVIYAPASRDVICFEPMTAPTNSISEYHRDKSINLPIITSGEFWEGKFTISLS